MIKSVLFVSLLLVAAAVATAEEHPTFFAWMKKHGKTYETPAEFARRLEIYNANLEFVKKHNEEAAKGKHTFTVGMNKMADLSNEEYRRMYLTYKRSNTTANFASPFNPRVALSDVPDTVDWRQSGAVTPVKDQGQCGSCWSFSTTGSIEGVWQISTGNLVSLSEQNLVDCVQSGQFTCETGGEMQVAFQYVIDNGGIETEDNYPYCACSGNSCNFDPSLVAAKISSYQSVPQGDENALQQATASNPVSIAIDASSQEFQMYSGGVFNLASCSSTNLDHGVLIVGYGTQDGSDYWLVKNSWSASWGLEGYIMMSRNNNNQCGVATDASYPVA